MEQALLSWTGGGQSVQLRVVFVGAASPAFAQHTVLFFLHGLYLLH
jgi:hypothetical protein